jgi:hypothetical protein
VILRSFLNGLTTIFISNRAPNYFSDSNMLRVYPTERRRRTILQATRQELKNSIGFKCARIGLVGISHGAHTHFETIFGSSSTVVSWKTSNISKLLFIRRKLVHTYIKYNLFFFFPIFYRYRHPFGLHCPSSKKDDEKYQLSANKFSGKQANFGMWAARFTSYAHSKGFDDILYG